MGRNKIPQLPLDDQCSACGVCVSVCKHHALKMEEDENGFYHVSFSKDSCIGCGLCEEHCHIIHPERQAWHDFKNTQPLAGWSTDPNIIRNSATGGIFSQIAWDMLGEGDCFVFGASLQENGIVKHIEIQRREDIQQLQNSKYQQSETTDVFTLVRQRLKEGKRVVFSGVPCQIAALYAFLGVDKQLREHLYTIEVICHGVPSNALQRLGLRYVKAKRILHYRNKYLTGWLYGANNRVSYIMGDGSVKYMDKTRNDFLFTSYLTFSFLRKNCYSCHYSQVRRVSDVTIGDFWGFEKSKRYDLYANYMGTSVIIANTEKGKQMLNNSKNIHLVDTSWREVLPLNQNLFMPTNNAIFHASDKIAKWLKYPEPFRQLLFMNGSTNHILQKIYGELSHGWIKSKRKKAEKEKKERLKETLEYLENNAIDK